MKVAYCSRASITSGPCVCALHLLHYRNRQVIIKRRSELESTGMAYSSKTVAPTCVKIGQLVHSFYVRHPVVLYGILQQY